MPVSEAGVLIVALSLCLTGAVVAQAEDEPMVPAAVYVSGVAVSEDTLWEDAVGDGGSAWEMEWSDPRLPTRMLIRHNGGGGYATHPAGEAMAMQMSTAVLLDGPEGDWVGSGWVLAWMWGSEMEQQEDWVEVLALEGDGAYEGLSATLRSTGHGGVPGPYEGFIFEGGLPPDPDPIEPPR
jgi:hypothetical protein